MRAARRPRLSLRLGLAGGPPATLRVAGSLCVHAGASVISEALRRAPTALLGVDGTVRCWPAVLGSASGLLNHATLHLRFGPIVQRRRGPEMHA